MDRARWKGPVDLIQYVNRYDNGILRADSFIRELFSSLDRKGYLQNSIVMILADHGEELGERGHYGHGSNLYQSQIRIPMLI
jgi:glucan phosphoethanolaminetransferase (alkaline phosphatase superfamily)